MDESFVYRFGWEIPAADLLSNERFSVGSPSFRISNVYFRAILREEGSSVGAYIQECSSHTVYIAAARYRC